jgi:pimeloyl-ACP methyl ester carboxylesterase
MHDGLTDEAARWAERATTVAVGGEAVAVIDVPAGGPRGPGGTPRPGGEAPPLLVVHGFPTSSVDFAPVLDRLAAARRVVLLDLPGYGLSAKPDRAYSLFGQADAVEAVTAALGLDEVDLLTHDMGDSVGGELLARAIDATSPLRVRRRVLTNGSVYLGMAQLTDGQKFLRALPDEMLAPGSGLDADGLTAALADLCAPDLRDDPAVVGRLRAGAELVVRDGGGRLLPRLIRYLDERAAHEERWTGAIESHPAPLTIVWGRHDPIAVAPMVDRLAARRAEHGGAATVTWLDAGHWPMVERPPAFADAVLAGLDAA